MRTDTHIHKNSKYVGIVRQAIKESEANRKRVGGTALMTSQPISHLV